MSILVVAVLMGAALYIGLAILATRATTQRQAALERNGTALEAEVTNLYIRRIRGVISSSPAYYVGYTYRTSSQGPRRAGNYRIDEAAYHRLKPGDPIGIIVLPNQPDVSRPAAVYLDPDTERSSRWSPLWVAGGAGVILLLTGIVAWSTTAQRTAPPASLPAEIHAALDPKMAGWREAATTRTVRLSATDAGFASSSDFREVYYGKCSAVSGTRFYLYVFNFISGKSSDAHWLGVGYGYTPGSARAADCVPEDWSVATENALEGDWYAVSVTYPAQIPFYRLTATAQAP